MGSLSEAASQFDRAREAAEQQADKGRRATQQLEGEVRRLQRYVHQLEAANRWGGAAQPAPNAGHGWPWGLAAASAQSVDSNNAAWPVLQQLRDCPQRPCWLPSQSVPAVTCCCGAAPVRMGDGCDETL